jgi:tetratricopeptide (TPR) repeat protein
MKFKPIYLYGLLIAAVAVILIIVSQQNSNGTRTIGLNRSQNIPDDEVHQQLNNQGSNLPGKENISESYKQKLSELKTAVKKNPGDTLALREYADFLAASHKMDEAINYYEKILKNDNQRTDIYFSLSLIYYNKNDLVKAEDQNKRVLAYDLQNQMALYNIGAIAATKGDVNKAKEFWDRVIKLNPESETGKLAAESLEKLQ